MMASEGVPAVLAAGLTAARVSVHQNGVGRFFANRSENYFPRLPVRLFSRVTAWITKDFGHCYYVQNIIDPPSQ